MTPPTIRFHHMHDRLKHQAPRVVVGMSNAPNWWEQSFEPLPYHVEHILTGGQLHLRWLVR